MVEQRSRERQRKLERLLSRGTFVFQLVGRPPFQRTRLGLQMDDYGVYQDLVRGGGANP